MARVLLLFPLFSLLLGGCLTSFEDLDAPGLEWPRERAMALVASAQSAQPDRVHLRGTYEVDGTLLMRLASTTQNATGRTAIDLTLDAEGWASISGGKASDAPVGRVRALLSSVESTYEADGVVYAVPESGEIPGIGPDPLRTLFKPETFLAEVPAAEFVSAKPLLHEGTAALEVRTRVALENQTSETAVVVALDPPRILSMDIRMPGDLFGLPGKSLRVALDFPVGAEDVEAALHDVAHAARLRHRVDRDAFRTTRDPCAAEGGSCPQPDEGPPGDRLTVTFEEDSGVPLHRVEVEVRAGPAGTGAAERLAAPILLVLPLSEGEAEKDDIRARFVDENGDGLVSRGEAVIVEAPGGQAVHVTLHDLETGLRVIPGAGGWLLLAVGATAAVARRR